MRPRLLACLEKGEGSDSIIPWQMSPNKGKKKGLIYFASVILKKGENA